MKRTMVAAGLTVWVAAGCVGTREATIGPMPIGGEDDVVAVAYDEGTRELVLEMAPVDLPANAGHHIAQPQPGEAEAPVRGYLQGYRVELLDARGRPVPREAIHHVNIMAPERRELFSPIMQRIGAVGHETATVELPGVIGYPIREGDRILVSAMLHNPTDQSYEGVRVRVRFRHKPEGVIDPIAIYPFYLDVTPPASLHSFELPPGRSEHSWEGKPAVSGRILGMGGHLHEHAIALRLTDVTANRVLYETRPVLDQDGTVIGMPQDFFLTRLGIKVEAGHTYRLTAIYENPTGATIPDGGMGALGGIFKPSRGASWPGVDRSHAEYVKDYEIRTTPHWTEMRGAPASRQSVDHSGHGTHRH